LTARRFTCASLGALRLDLRSGAEMFKRFLDFMIPELFAIA
jgi:hypothetical protein